VCGIVMSHYTFHNVTVQSKYSTAHSFSSVGYMAEMFVYMSLGLFFKPSIDSSHLSVGFAVLMMATIIVTRLFTVMLICGVVNAIRGERHFTWSAQGLITWGGLIRGVLSFALSKQLDETGARAAAVPLIQSTTYPSSAPTPLAACLPACLPACLSSSRCPEIVFWQDGDRDVYKLCALIAHTDLCQTHGCR
jgi:NhaP-type Na+/H+ or K+/H+ antiporter